MSMKIKCVLFDIGDVLYDASLQISTARMNAVKAMIEAGLPTDVESAYNKLQDVVKKCGPDYNRHFDKLLEQLGLKWNPRVIAAGVAAYREMSSTYLKPYPDTIPTLLRLRESGYKIGVVTEGRAVKQWQKLIQLGIQHLFHFMLTSEEVGAKEMNLELFKTILKQCNVESSRVIFVGNRPDMNITYANNAGLVSVRIRRGEHKTQEPRSKAATARYDIRKLSEIFNVLERMQKQSS